MSRSIIGVVAATVIAALTATAYVVTASSLEDEIGADVERRVAAARELLIQTSSIEMLGLLQRAESLARDDAFVKALGEKPEPRAAEQAFRDFRAGQGAGEPRPDVLAVVDRAGRLISLMSGDQVVISPVPDAYQRDGALKYPALDLALARRQATAEIWDYEALGPMRVGAAPVIDGADEVVGAVVVAYALGANQVRAQARLLGVDVAYVLGDRVYASSVARPVAQALGAPLAASGLAARALGGGAAEVAALDVGGETYRAAAARLPRFASRPLPADHPTSTAGAVVLASLDDARAPLDRIGLGFLLVGLGAIVVAVLAVFLTARTILGPLDEIEVGINDIISGNTERTFRPVGSDLDGLANALNVMLARLLGRPEPGDEEYDDDGNVVKHPTGERPAVKPPEEG
jgi:hypothetical protein